MTFLSHLPLILNFLLFSYFCRIYTFPTDFGKNFIFPYLFTFPPVFVQFMCFWRHLCVFGSPHVLTMMQLCIIQYMYWTPLGFVLFFGWTIF